MNDATSLFTILRRSADSAAVAEIERLIQEAPDRQLNRINVLAVAARTGLDEERLLAAFLHAARLGLFDMSWNILCPTCCGVLNAGTSLKAIDRNDYHCTFCAADTEPTLDDKVEVTFTVSPRIRRIAGHDPDTLPMWDYTREIFWSSGIDLPEDFDAAIDDIVMESVELPAGERAVLSLQLAPAFHILFDPVTHASQFLDVKGEPTRERQSVTLVLNEVQAETETQALRPGPLRISLENRSRGRVLPGLWIAEAPLMALLNRRRPFLTGKRLLTNQTFRDVFQVDTLDINQRLKITSLTFLFTDLKGSTALYERVGDLVAYDIVRAHFEVLAAIIAKEAGAIVKTIGDAVMATFATPDRAVAAALAMREAMRELNVARGGEDLLLKIGIHEGPCLAVSLNDRQDYFGQTVNIASRVQNLATSRSIVATGAVAEDPTTRALIESRHLTPVHRQASLRGIHAEHSIYEIP